MPISDAQARLGVLFTGRRNRLRLQREPPIHKDELQNKILHEVWYEGKKNTSKRDLGSVQTQQGRAKRQET